MLKLLIPILLVVAGGIVVSFVRSHMLNRVREMKFMHTSTVQEVLDTYRTMEESGMGDTFRSYVELKGRVHTPQPVYTPFSNQPVAYCASRVFAVTQTVEHYKDDEGNMKTRTVKREEPLSNEESSHTLQFRDNSTDTTVTLDINHGCTFDVPETFDRFESPNAIGHYPFFAHFHMSRPNLIGYRMQESTIPLDHPLYVIGEAYKEGGVLHIGKPTGKDKIFIVSPKSEDELVGKYEGNARLALFGGIAMIAVGVIWLVAMILK